MGGPQIVVGQNRPAHEGSRLDPSLGWGAVRTLALLFVLAGLIDIVIAFYPPRFSEKAWLFGVLGGVIGGLPVLSLGLTGSLVAAISMRAEVLTRVLSILNAVLALLVLVALILYLGAIGEVKRNAALELMESINRNVVRTTLVGLLYFLLHATAFWVGRRPNMFAGPNS